LPKKGAKFDAATAATAFLNGERMHSAAKKKKGGQKRREIFAKVNLAIVW